jgi:hypothetical protein
MFSDNTNHNAISMLARQPRATQKLGVVVGGSISRGLAVKLDPSVSIEDLAVGRYVVIRGERKRFFCMVSDIVLDSTNPGIQNDPPDVTGNEFLRQVYMGTVAYSLITVTPMLVIDDKEGNLPVKTIPPHFTAVLEATENDVNAVFGAESEKHFHVGAPLELEHTQINLDLKRLVERSVGVFGKSGTGKSFLTRLLLAGVVQKGVGQTLIFDMHNDYGWETGSENGTSVKGLAQLFPEKVSILSLDEASSMKRNSRTDFVVQIGYDEIEPEDIAMLKATMNLSDTMIDAAYSLAKLWGANWIYETIHADADKVEKACSRTSVLSGTFAGLQRRLSRFERWHFLVPKSETQTNEKTANGGTVNSSIRRIIDLIVHQGKSVVLEFGRYGNELEAYMLVANYITRRIHREYVDRTEKSIGEGTPKPPNLVITIEEAHKFLEPQVARQTTFGIIAREMRKYNVTLLVVDQRPSAIDDEVMSQIGTRVTALLDNERDISAVLNGVSGAASLREVLARLETKQQAIVMGHAVPMPVVMKPRTYDTSFYQAMQHQRPNSDEGRQLLGGKRPRF